MIEVVRLREVEGLGVRAIAKRLGLSRNTVRKYLREPRVPVYGPRSRTPSKLAPFLPWLTQRTSVDGMWNSVRLLRELRERGYTGGRTILKDYLRPLRPPKTARVVVRYEVPPGVEAQVDFGVFQYEDPSSFFRAFRAWTGRTPEASRALASR